MVTDPDNQEPPVEEPPHQQRKRRRHKHGNGRESGDHEKQIIISDSVANIIGGRTLEHLTNFSSLLSFRKFVAHLQWNPVLVRSFQANENTMMENVSQMVSSASDIDSNHGILQHFELARQFEAIAEHQNRHVYSVINDICGEGHQVPSLSVKYAKEVMKAVYAMFKYPVLSQVEASWSDAIHYLPAVADLFDKLILQNQLLPANVMMAQEERHKVSFFSLIIFRTFLWTQSEKKS